MSFIGSFGSFLGGATAEAAKIRQEREDREQKNLGLTMSILQNIIDNPQIDNPQLKQEALNATRDVLMTHVFPGQFRAKGGKLSKLVEQFVGQNSDQQGAQLSGIVGQLSGEGRGEGATRGKATSSVGGLNQPMRPNIPMPTPQAGTPLPPPIGMEGQDQLLTGGGPPPMLPDIQPQVPQQDILSGLPQGTTTSAGFKDNAARTREAAESAILQGRIGNQMAAEKAKQGLDAFFQHPSVKGILDELDPQQKAQIVASSLGLDMSIMPKLQQQVRERFDATTGKSFKDYYNVDYNGKATLVSSEEQTPLAADQQIMTDARTLFEAAKSDPKSPYKGKTLEQVTQDVRIQDYKQRLETANLRVATAEAMNKYRDAMTKYGANRLTPQEDVLFRKASEIYADAEARASVDLKTWQTAKAEWDKMLPEMKAIPQFAGRNPGPAPALDELIAKYATAGAKAQGIDLNIINGLMARVIQGVQQTPPPMPPVQ